MDITDLGVRILFFPVVLILGILILGIALFVAVNIVSLIIKIPFLLFDRSIGESDKKEQEEFKIKDKKDKRKFSLRELWFQIEKGEWIIWVAALPLVILVFAVLLNLWLAIF